LAQTTRVFQILTDCEIWLHHAHKDNLQLSSSGWSNC